MDFIQQSLNNRQGFWRYLVGSLIVIVAAFIGQLPFVFAAFAEAANQGLSPFEVDETTMLGLLESNYSLFLMLISFAVALVGLFIILKPLHEHTIKMITTAREKVDWKRILFAFFFWGVVSSGLTLLDYYTNPDDYVMNFNAEKFAILAVIAIVLVPIQTSAEEYIFRGYLMQGFGNATLSKYFPFGFILTILAIPICLYFSINYKLDSLEILGVLLVILLVGVVVFELLKKQGAFDSNLNEKLYVSLKRKWVPLFITSVIFGMLHVFNPEVEKLGYSVMVYYIGTGLFLGIITLMDDGIELALGFHAANNLFTALLVTADWTAFQTHSVFKDMSDPSQAGFFEIFLPVFIVFPILIFIFAKKYKWANWREKLIGRVKVPSIRKEDYKILEDSDTNI